MPVGEALRPFGAQKAVCLARGHRAEALDCPVSHTILRDPALGPSSRAAHIRESCRRPACLRPVADAVR
jgi:hypothetical protein